MESSTGNKKLDTLRDRACSKIIWGEREEVVYQFLRQEGVSAEMADQFINQAFRERAALIRKRSIIKLIAGLIGTIACGVGLGFIEFSPNVHFTGRGYWKVVGMMWVGFSASGIFALKNAWALISGKTLGSALED